MQGRQGKLIKKDSLNIAIRNSDFRNPVAVHFIETLCCFGIEKVLPKRKGQDYNKLFWKHELEILHMDLNQEFNVKRSI